MQKISSEGNAVRVLSADFPRRAIKRISDHRMSQRGQMHPDLVGPAGVNLHIQQRKLPKLRIDPPPYRVVSDGLASARPPRGHPCTAHPIAADAAGNLPAILLYPAVHQRDVNLLDLAPSKLRRQPAMGFVVLCHHYQPAGGLIQTVHNARTQLAPYAREP